MWRWYEGAGAAAGDVPDKIAKRIPKLAGPGR